MPRANHSRKQISAPLREALERLRKEARNRSLTADEQRFMIEALGESVASLSRSFGCWDSGLHRVINRTPGRSLPEVCKQLARFLSVPVASIGRESGQKPKKKAA